MSDTEYREGSEAKVIIKFMFLIKFSLEKSFFGIGCFAFHSGHLELYQSLFVFVKLQMLSSS